LFSNKTDNIIFCSYEAGLIARFFIVLH